MQNAHVTGLTSQSQPAAACASASRSARRDSLLLNSVRLPSAFTEMASCFLHSQMFHPQHTHTPSHSTAAYQDMSKTMSFTKDYNAVIISGGQANTTKLTPSDSKFHTFSHTENKLLWAVLCSVAWRGRKSSGGFYRTQLVEACGIALLKAPRQGAEIGTERVRVAVAARIKHRSHNPWTRKPGGNPTAWQRSKLPTGHSKLDESGRFLQTLAAKPFQNLIHLTSI